MILWDRLAGQAAHRPDAPAVAAPDGTLSYAELASAAEAAAADLAVRGVGAGDRVAYLGLNSAALIVLVFAAARGGFVLAPLNWRLAAEELTWIVAHADPRLVVADGHFAELAREAAGGRPVLDAAPFGRAAFPLPQPPSRAEGGAPGREGRAPSTAPDGAVLLVYTSGATGRPKGAVLTQAAVVANAGLSADMHGLSEADHVLTALPMFHVGGLNIQTLPALLKGARVTLMERFEPGACLGAIAALRPSLTVQVPATLQAMMAHPGWAGADLSSLRAIATGSTDVPVALIEAVHGRGVPVIQIYGATETGPVVIYQKVEDAHARLGSIGRAGPGVEVRLVAEGRDVAEGEAGEIWLRSPTLASGYWRNPEADAAFAGGWFRTGDLARRDGDGFYWFADRLKNVIISGGENIYPAELERVLATIPGVREAAVAARPDPRWGAVPVAVVVGEAERAQVLGAFQGRLARFKHPKDVVFAEALPRNAMGKVDQAALRRLAAEG